MIKTRIFSAFAAAALVGVGTAPAFAKSQDSQVVGGVGASSDKSARKTCKRFDHSASRLRGETVCLTKAQWKKLNSQN